MNGIRTLRFGKRKKEKKTTWTVSLIFCGSYFMFINNKFINAANISIVLCCKMFQSYFF